MVLGAAAATATLIWAGMDDMARGEVHIRVFVMGYVAVTLGIAVSHGIILAALAAIIGPMWAYMARIFERLSLWSRGDSLSLALAIMGAGMADGGVWTFSFLPLGMAVMIGWSRWRLGTDENGNVRARIILAFAVPPAATVASSLL